MKRIKHGIFIFTEKLLHWCISPYFRAKVIKLLGGDIGKNVRIYEAKFFNLANGFKNLHVERDAFIGTEALIDLTDKVIIKRGAVIGQRVIIFTHQDPGYYHKSPLCKVFPPDQSGVEIGEYCWIGSSTIILLGSKIGNFSVIGANSLVNKNIPSSVLALGNPARKMIKLKIGGENANEF